MIKKGNEIFGNNIKTLREIHKESLKDLADAIGVEYQSIQKYENGISIPSKKNLENILRHYNYLTLSEDDLISLLESASYSLPKNNYFDLIIRFCFINKIYKLDEVNELLYDYNCKCL